MFAEAHAEDSQDTQSADVSSELEELRVQLEKANSELDRLQRQLHDIIKTHKGKLEKERRQVNQLRRQMCDRVGKLDSALAEKDALIEGLSHQLARSARAVSEDCHVQRAREQAEEEGAMMQNVQLPQALREDPPHDPLYPPAKGTFRPR